MADLTPRADVAKCPGMFRGDDGRLLVCPLRDNCLRYLRPSAPKGQAFWAIGFPEQHADGWWCFDQIKTERTNG